MTDAVEKVLDARCFNVGEGRTGFGLVNRGLGLRGRCCSSTPFLLRTPFTVGRAVVVRRRFGLSQLISLGISSMCCGRLVVVMFGLRTRNYKLTRYTHTIAKEKVARNENIHSREKNEEGPEPRTVSETSYQVGSSGWVGGAGSRTYAGWLQGDEGCCECARAGAERLCVRV